MPLIPAQQMLQTAKEKGYCIAGFDVFNLEFLEAVLRTSERLRSPVMIQTSFMNFDFYTKEYLCGAILSALESTTIPAAFHLDHGAREMHRTCVTSRASACAALLQPVAPLH